jgi:hypothetical protein
METLTTPKEIILATKVEAKTDGLWITTKSGEYLIPWEECSAKLAHATELQRTFLETTPSGYGIHWPLLDEDLAVGPLVKVRKAVNQRRMKGTAV